MASAQRFSVVVFSNDGAFNSGGMAQKVVDIYLKKEIAAKEKSRPKKKVTQKVADKEKKAVSVDVETLKTYVGSYELQPNFIIRITEENGKLFGQATGQPRLELIPLTVNKFSVRGVPAEVSFHKDADGRVNLLKLNQGGRLSDAPR